jgi:hypothetical protein
MDDDIIIRQARPEDIPSLCGLLEDLFSLEADFEPDPEKQVRGLSMLVTDPSGSSLVLVAVKNGIVVGMATVQTLVSTAEGGTGRSGRGRYRRPQAPRQRDRHAAAR